jgi:DNA-binding NtrC family response regulator
MRAALASDRFDLALIDLGLPDELGLDLASSLDARDVPVVVTSGSLEALEQTSDIPYPFLPKPFRRADLVALVADTISGSRARKISKAG